MSCCAISLIYYLVTYKMNDIFEVLVSSDSNTAIGSARVWNYKTGNCLHYYKSGGTIHSNGLSFVSNDYFIGAEINKPIINVWPVNSQEPLKNLKLVCPGRVNALAVSPDGHYLAAGISEELYIWQIVTGQLLAVVRKHFQPIVKILFTGDGSYLVTGGQDGVAVVWSMAIILSKETMNTSQFEPLQVFSEHAMPVTGMCINGTGRFARLITVSGDHTIKVHELFSGELLVSVIFNEPLSAVVAHPSGHSVFVGMSNGDIRQISFQRPPRTRMHHEETSGMN